MPAGALPVGSFDAEAERYEYVLKLAVPVKFHNHLRDNIDKIQAQLLADIATVTAPYSHESISAVFVALKIEQDLAWRDAAMDLIVEGRGRDTKKENDILIMHAPADENGIVGEMKAALGKKNVRVATHSIVSVKDKDIHARLPNTTSALTSVCSWFRKPQQDCRSSRIHWAESSDT